MSTIFNKESLYIKEVINHLLPNARFSFKVQNDIQLDLPDQLKGSQYERVLNEDSFFLHFTSLNGLLEIIRSKRIRMSDFNSFDDPFEMVLANRNIVGDYNRFEILKSCLFALSLCEDKPENLQNDYMWSNFAVKDNPHKGVCIRFRIDKEKSKLYFFHLGKIHYCNNENISELLELRERHNRFVEKYNFKIDNLDSLLLVVCSMYKKSEPFKNENEIRLLTYVWKNSNSVHSNLNFPIRHKYQEDEDQIQYFFELELERNQQLGGCPSPYISIDSIHYGKNLDQDKLGRLHSVIKYEFMDSFGRDLKIF